MDAKQFIQVMNMDYLKKEKEPMKQFDYAMVKDPEYFRDGRLDAHSDMCIMHLRRKPLTERLLTASL